MMKRALTADDSKALALVDWSALLECWIFCPLAIPAAQHRRKHIIKTVSCNYGDNTVYRRVISRTFESVDGNDGLGDAFELARGVEAFHLFQVDVEVPPGQNVRRGADLGNGGCSGMKRKKIRQDGAR